MGRVGSGHARLHITCVAYVWCGCGTLHTPRSQVVHLAVYHMMTEEEGRHGFFRWNDHICMFIKNNWSRLLPYRKKTGSWQSTVAGVLSQFSPSIFKSGTVCHLFIHDKTSVLLGIMATAGKK